MNEPQWTEADTDYAAKLAAQDGYREPEPNYCQHPLRPDFQYDKPAFQPATWGGLVLWVHILCGGLNKWPSANDTPTRCWTCKQPTDEDTWELLYERIKQ